LAIAKILFLVATVLLTLSVALAVTSLFPISTGENQSSVFINNTFNLSPNETYRQGLGSFRGGENISLQVESPVALVKNFSIVTYNGLLFSNFTSLDVAYNFTASADYYEAVFFSNSTDAGTIHFEVSVLQPKIFFPFSPLNATAKTLFLLSLGLALLALLKRLFSKQSKSLGTPPNRAALSRINRNRLLALLLLSLVFWLSLLAINSTPLGTFENWYTDHARHSYESSLFLKDGFSVFNTPLGKLASQDHSTYKFVTWPEMPHLYPLGSILLFLPFGALLQSGFDPVLIYKLEIALFFVFAHVCLYFFLPRYLKKDMNLLPKLVGVYIIYVSLVIYAANGMFDSVAFLFSVFALVMFVAERYDYFFLLVGFSVFLKYQVGIFLFPLILVGLLMFVEKNRLRSLMRNWAFIGGAAFMLFSGFTACLSAPFLIQTKPEFITNGINGFSPNAQIPWSLQSLAVLLTLAATLVYVFYMLKRNSSLSLSALFLLLPSFMLPFFQNWYIPYMFVYILIPQEKKQLEATIIWLIFMIAVLSFGGVAFSSLQIFDTLKSRL
jgi:hypothetical protein